MYLYIVYLFAESDEMQIVSLKDLMSREVNLICRCIIMYLYI